jgi:hypothetical protein
MSFPRLSFTVVEKWVFGVNLQLEECGCKHLDLCLGEIIVVIHFGVCRRK